MVWRWTTDGQYSAGSCYDTLFQGAIISGSWKLNWKSWAPPMVKFFIWLACLDRTVWFEVMSWIRSTSGPPTAEGDFAEWWSLVVRTAPRQLRKGTSSVIMLTAWWIWKHRNAAVFDNARPSVTSLFNDITADARLWADDTSPTAAAIAKSRFGGQKSLFRHPAGRGIAPGVVSTAVSTAIFTAIAASMMRRE
ncbi:hypothetical protein QYE76_066384 [Lolium multiflorum]|uniref:Reverse transcriptase zinc-binding domain-containing protein n=1 Tax=Lolium multiflorum TaxID=4521 RepID=A0AAD8SB84_LOLMU|nr:hypothetical protein QYE76_066384 [Lolium multiflorum]